MRASLTAMAAATAIAVMLIAMPAKAYVCARVNSDGDSTGSSLSWFHRDLTYDLFADGTATVPGDGEFGVLRDSFTVWTTLQLGDGDTPEACGLTTSHRRHVHR